MTCSRLAQNVEHHLTLDTWAALPGCTVKPNRCRRADCTTGVVSLSACVRGSASSQAGGAQQARVLRGLDG
jgi:hypothetical protein